MRKSGGAVLAVLTVFAMTSLSCAQDVKWHTRLSDATAAAKSNSHRLLIFFSATGADSVKHYDRIFRDPQVARELSANYECVQLDFSQHREMAAKMHVFRAGIIALYQSTGAPIDRIDNLLEADELVDRIRLRPIVYVPTPGTARASSRPPSPARTAAPTPVIAVQGTPPPPMPKGKRILGPVTKDIRTSNPVQLGVLKNGSKYVLVLEGMINLWFATETVGRADALYFFNRPTSPGVLELSGTLRLLDGNKKLYDYIRETTGNYPVYRKDHKYEVLLTGRGRNETLYIYEVAPKNYLDNSGELTFTLFEGK